MTAKRMPHAVYDSRAPKYRKWVLRGGIGERVRSIFEKISLNHGFELDKDESCR